MSKIIRIPTQFILAAALILSAGCVPLQMEGAPEMGTVPPAAEEDDGAVPMAMATITTPSLVLRRFPAEDSPALAALEEGEEFKVIGISTDGTWVRLEALDAPTGAGWVAARFVSVEGDITDVPITDGSGEATVRPTPPPDGAVVLTDGTRLRVRVEPDPDATIITFAYDGEVYTVLEITEDGQWTRIDAPGMDDGGWVASEFLEFGDENADRAVASAPTPTNAAEETDAAAETEAEIETEPADDAAAPETAEEAAITETEDANTENADTESTEEDGTETEAATGETESVEETNDAVVAERPTPGPGEAVVITDGSRLRVRSEPDTNATILSFVNDGELYTILEFNEDGSWTRIDVADLPDGGWVSTEFLEIGANGTSTEGAEVADTQPVTVADVLTETATTADSAAITETAPITTSAAVTAAANVGETEPFTETVAGQDGPDITDVPEPNPGEAVVFTDGTRLRVRSEPSTDSEIIGYVYNGEVYNVLEVSEDGEWVRIDVAELPDGGWVADLYVLTAEQ
jgi:uncharacterized protein YgiM (DUF1202 family)